MGGGLYRGLLRWKWSEELESEVRAQVTQPWPSWEDSPPSGLLSPACGQAWAADAPCADSCPHAWPEAGVDPNPCLTLSGLACVQLPGHGQGLGPSFSCGSG